MGTENRAPSYKRITKNSNVVVIMNVTQDLYARLLLEITSSQTPLPMISSGFNSDEGQAKFTMGTTEAAERVV